MKPTHRSKPVEVFAWRPGFQLVPECWDCRTLPNSGLLLVSKAGVWPQWGIIKGQWLVVDTEGQMPRVVPDSNGSPEGYEPLTNDVPAVAQEKNNA